MLSSVPFGEGEVGCWGHFVGFVRKLHSDVNTWEGDRKETCMGSASLVCVGLLFQEYKRAQPMSL